ncbi:MAG: xanthine dehydrogenase family protein molybdopterin-binding subunit, partial [bacterium]
MALSAYRGARIKRIEDPRLITGRGTFVDDLTFPGLRHVAVVRSPHAHALIRVINAPTSVELITARDLGDPLWLPGKVKGALARHPAVAMDRACYVGQPVALVIADDAYKAADAADQVHVDWEPLPAVLDLEEGLRPDAARVHPDLPSNVAYHRQRRYGTPEKAFAQAAVIVTQRIRHQRLAAVPLETRAVAAVPPSGRERRLTVWSSTQMPHALRDILERLPPLAGIKVRVIAPDVGGGFGAKINIYSEEILLPVLAMRLGRPVKWIQTRREDLIATSHGRSQFADVRISADRTGRIMGLHMRVVADVGAYILSTTAEVPTLTLLMVQGPYDLHDVEVELLEVYTNKVPTGAYRGAGRPEAAFYLERAIDLLARELDIDPVEIRRRNFIAPEQFPKRALSGAIYDSGNYARALDLVLKAVDYGGWRSLQAEERRRGRYLGIGVASYVEWCTFGEDRCKIQVDREGKVMVLTGISPHGQGAATGLAQIVADTLGVHIQDVTVAHGDTALITDGQGTAGSRSLVVGG